MQEIDYYEVLGVSSKSDEVVIRAAYKAMMLKYHPDTSAAPGAEARAKAINEAFAVLGNPEERKKYDAARATAGNAEAPPPPPPPPPPSPPVHENDEAPEPRRRQRHLLWGVAAAVLAVTGYLAVGSGAEDSVVIQGADSSSAAPSITTSPTEEIPADVSLGGPTMHKLDFSDGAQSKTITYQGVKVRIQMQPGKESSYHGIAAVEVPGHPMKMLDLGDTFSEEAYQVGIGKLAASDPTPSVIIKQFTGGAHCCYATKILQARAGRVVEIDFGEWDAGADFDTFPSDIDGDGIVDFVMRDGAFHYSFTNYASSLAPPKILNIYKGSVVDVSDQPAFRNVFEEFSKESKAACSDLTDVYRNGACAAFVASEARLGRITSALSMAEQYAYSGSEAWYPEDCEVELVDYQCPPSRAIKFYSFGDAIRWFLRKHGYT